jgi:hypothetical protein
LGIEVGGLDRALAATRVIAENTVPAPLPDYQPFVVQAATDLVDLLVRPDAGDADELGVAKARSATNQLEHCVVVCHRF